ncbi:MAG: ABC transporter permease [Solirubrobacterales bacterium]
MTAAPPLRLLMPLLAAEALANVRAVGQRSLLALLGIVIGTAAVIAMVNIGDNASAESMRAFEAMGPDLIVVQNGFSAPGKDLGLPADALERLSQSVAQVAMVAPLTTAGRRLGRGAGIPATLVGATPGLTEAARLRLAEGRFVSPFDRLDTFAVVGARVATALSLKVGDRLRLDNYLFTVIGVLEEAGANPLMPFEVNEAVVVPLAAMRRLVANPAPSTALARAAAGTDAVEAGAALAAKLQELRHGRAVQVQSARQLVEGMRKQAQLFTALLAAIGAISLVVGGVGVMNVMLMNVSERRREIGLRMAVGARRSHIRAMFLFEAATLSLAGGAAGTVLGVLAALAFASVSGWQFALAAEALPLGGMISVVTGLFFGAYPAASAAALDPIETLRAA